MVTGQWGTSVAAPGSVGVQAPMNRTALVVEDDPKFLTFIGRTLKRAGFDVLTANDGAEVSDVLDRKRVDVVVLDLEMPGMNGWEVMRSFRERTRMKGWRHGESPKVVVVSGRAERETVEFVQRLGVDAYLTKPVLGKELVAGVRGVLGK